MHEALRFERLRFPDDGSVVDVDDFDVSRTERVGLYGPNGAGKTTLLRLLAGTTAGATRNPSVAYLPQRPYLFRGSARSNLLLGVDDEVSAIEAAERLGVMSVLDGDAATLSGGERQRIAIARTLADRHPLVALDEPLAAIDRADRNRVIDVIRDRTVDRALVCVTHDFEAALAIAETLAVMDGGRIVQRGPIHDVAADPATRRVEDIIGISNVLRGRVTAHDAGLSVVSVGSHSFLVAAEAPIGADVVIRFGAGTVAVHASPPSGGSQRNVIPGVVASIVDRGVMVEMTLGGDQALAAVVTQGALDALGVEEGSAVWFAIKTAAIEVVAVR
ncbi:MAG: ATP-binding cassette domain-containing protein [Acidimicrobiia bacterium]|nr:ATP-binding cassette domain-containing protein [Acidimicrobiia bacterium]